MSIELAGGEDLARDITGIVQIVDPLPGRKYVLELQDLEHRGEQDRVSVRDAESHGLVKEALMDQEPAVGVLAKQIELAGLIGRTCDGDAVRTEKVGQSGRHGIPNCLRASLALVRGSAIGGQNLV
nr:hypothetical protein [Bradyrhizobium sp. SZCCHNPS10061]